jgi:DNA modification methylase
LTVLQGLESESVHCVVTSPPYWGLRDYGTAKWEGGDAECDHKGPPLCSDKSGLAGFTSENIKLRTNGTPFRDTCGKCGATRIDSQLGLERTPEEYIERMVGVFREVKRVLRSDGTCWVNMGDSYASDTKGSGGPSEKQLSNNGSRYTPIKLDHGLKPKDLCGIPWMLAFALRADGWYLRSDIIWAKPNPMPESVTDRPTKSHEYIFLLSKSQSYYYDAEAIKEPPQRIAEVGWKDSDLQKYSCDERLEQQGSHKDWRKYCPTGEVTSRNKRTVWTVATQPTPDAHFATFPEDFDTALHLGGHQRERMLREVWRAVGACDR